MYISILYILTGYILSIYIDDLFIIYYGTDFESKTTRKLIIEVCIQAGVIGIISYIFRNLIQMIPFIFEGVYGYKHLKVKELAAGSILTTYMVIFQYNFQNKLKFIRNRTFNEKKLVI